MVPTSNACTYNPGEAYKNEKNIAKVTYEENNKEHKVQEHIYYRVKCTRGPSTCKGVSFRSTNSKNAFTGPSTCNSCHLDP